MLLSREAIIFGNIVAIIFSISLLAALNWIGDSYPRYMLYSVCGAIFILCVALGFLLDRKSGGQ